MNIPNFPTDNLYKFISISGMILFLVSLFYPTYLGNKLNNDIAIYNGEIKKLSIENKKSKSKLDEIKDEIRVLDEKGNFRGSITNDTMIVRTKVIVGDESLVLQSKKIDQLVSQWEEINRQIELKSIDINVKFEQIKNNRKDLDDLDEASSIFGPISILITLLGFLLWYNKTQKYQDRVLIEQTEKMLDIELCQSCGMRLNNQKNYHNFTHEEKKSIYCKECYLNGEFTEPDLTLDEMKNKIKNRCKELKFSKIVVYIFTKRLNGLERWRNKFNW